jgi:CHAT domain-containing protein
VLAKPRYDKFLLLVTRKNSRYPFYIRLGTDKEINSLLNKNNYINDTRKSNQLYKLLWLPLIPYLEGVHTIHLSPEGLLSKVAFETLVSNRASEERLMDQYQFRYYGTLKDFVLQARGIGQTSSAENKKAVLLGGALYNLDKTTLEQLGGAYPNEHSRTSGIGVTPDSVKVSEFNYLAGSQKEVEELASVLKKSGWDVDLLVGKGALEDKIKAIKGNDKPRILHLATHGYFFPKPEEEKQERILMSEDNIFQQRIQQHWHPLYRSGLALSGANHTWMGGTPPVNAEDGILTAYEVAMLDLYGTELVVLSACETGLGESSDTEGIYGLQRAFKQAGANKLIVSLWQVPDQQTQELMGYFYKNYLSGKSINESLETAKSTMRETYSNPYYWAAFILVE